MSNINQQRQLLTSMESAEYYTPSWYINKVKQLYNGVITLDPASCELAQNIVQAEKYYTKKDNGLSKIWFGDVFVNPPYCDEEGSRKALVPLWIDKAIDEYMNGNVNQMVILVNAKFGYNWFNYLVRKAKVVIAHTDRMAFITPKDMKPTKPSRQPQATAYFGHCSSDKFMACFGDLGYVLGKKHLND